VTLPNRDEKLEEARRLRRQGETYAAIALRLGLTKGGVYRWLNPDRSREYARRERAIRGSVGVAVQRAVEAGVLVKPKACQRCGNERFLEGHHHDYSKPLDVEWLCRGCHMAHHVAERKAA
jgi:predicted transcriptional regulator